MSLYVKYLPHGFGKAAFRFPRQKKTQKPKLIFAFWERKAYFGFWLSWVGCPVYDYMQKKIDIL